MERRGLHKPSLDGDGEQKEKAKLLFLRNKQRNEKPEAGCEEKEQVRPFGGHGLWRLLTEDKFRVGKYLGTGLLNI